MNLLLLSAGIFLAGCTVGPNYRPPSIVAPPSFDVSPGDALTAATTQPAGPHANRPVEVATWWKSLNDPELDRLVECAVAANYDLQIAVARLQEAREVEYVNGGGALSGVGATPGIEMVGAAGRSSGNDALRGRLGGPVYSGVDTTGLKEVTHAIGFDSGWELDLFGRYTRLLEASNADTQAAAEFRNDVLITVVADVVRAYIDVRSLQLRLEIARENVASEERMEKLVTIRFQRGLTNQLDAVLAKRQLSTTLSRIAPLEAAIAQAERRTAVLCGRYPDALRGELEKSAPLPATPPSVAAGMPVNLLRRRPDIRRAERQLAAATARIGVATANLFPRVSITAGAGLAGQGMGRTPVENSLVWSIGPTFYWPLLDFGQVDALVKVQDYQTRQLFFAYKKTIISAVQEVDNSLTNYDAQQKSLEQLNVAVDASHKAVYLASRRYEDGLADFLNVLDAQRQLYDLEDQYAVSQQTLTREFISLYKALGGGWEGFEGPPPAVKPLPAILAAGAETIGKPKQPLEP